MTAPTYRKDAGLTDVVSRLAVAEECTVGIGETMIDLYVESVLGDSARWIEVWATYLKRRAAVL